MKVMGKAIFYCLAPLLTTNSVPLCASVVKGQPQRHRDTEVLAHELLIPKPSHSPVSISFFVWKIV